jgi:isocitrate dehydrogenase
VQGKPVDLGGYYYPSHEKLQAIMCPRKTFNEALKSI